ncbi:unnamed protein product [Victoria cruziana]
MLSTFFLFHSSSSSYFQSGYHTGYLEEFTHHFTTGSEWISYCRRQGKGVRRTGSAAHPHCNSLHARSTSW